MSISHSMPVIEGVEFRTIERFLGYAFGSDGSVWSLWKGGNSITKSRITDTWKKMSQNKHRVDVYASWHGGYWRVNLRVNAGKSTRFLVHRMILEAFHGPCPDGLEGCHNDANKDNNRADNLRWATKMDNAADRDKHGGQARGSRCKSSKLNETKVVEMRNLKDKGGSFNNIAIRFGVSISTAMNVCMNRTWKHVDPSYSYKPRRNQNMSKPKPQRAAEMVARDLFMLCRRAKMKLLVGDAEGAKEVLDHAPRIAERIGIKEEIVRAV